MLFTLGLFASATQSMALRPELNQASMSSMVSKVASLVSAPGPRDASASIHAAVGVMNDILADTQNATAHMTDDDADLLQTVIELLNKQIYVSMDDAHQADLKSLAAQLSDVGSCNSEIKGRQSPEGDLGILQTKVNGKQTELDRLQGVVDDKTAANNTAWDSLQSHMQMISQPPACPEFPARTKPSLDLYFESSLYVIWYSGQQTSYNKVRDDFGTANDELEQAIVDFNTQKATRDVQYCDWKDELLAACTAFDECFSQKSSYYSATLVPSVKSSMASRIEVFKSGQELEHQILFLLAKVDTQQAPEADTKRYEITFQELPEKGLCDLTVLDADIYVPEPECTSVGKP